ncbi:hypothetical protein D3C74_400620 [compost metagenome]
MRVYFPFAPSLIIFGIHCHHNTLGAKAARAFQNKLRIIDCGRVNADFIRTGTQNPLHIVHCRYPAANCKGNRDLTRSLPDNLNHRSAPFHRSRNIQKHQFIGTFAVI